MASSEREVAKRLGLVVEQEARRVLGDVQLRPDPERIADGWERRFIADAERATEVIDLYEQLGYEVCADPVRPEQLDDDCSDCWLRTHLQFVTIYTRQNAERRAGDGRRS